MRRNVLGRNVLGTAALCAALALPPALAAEEPPALASLQWIARPIIVFADSPADPRVEQQIRMLEKAQDALSDREVQVFVDTDPTTLSEMRQRFRPRDFTVVLVGKDGQLKYRKPKPVKADEFTRLIDRMPMRIQEMLDRGQTLRP